jgi:hypothetical protein
MSRCSDRQLVPRNGHMLLVGIGARISGCAGQKEISLDDQVDHGKEIAAEYWDGPVEFRVVATKGKGEALDRPELVGIEAEYRRGEVDLFIWEDLGRLVRGAEATRLLGIGVDHGVRTIVPNDCIDTAEPTWEEDALHACASHVAHNAHTSKRIKKKLMNRFAKFGGAPGRPIYGYVVPEGAKTYDDWLKDPAASWAIQEGARRLLAMSPPNCTAVADWFNAAKVPVGPYCRRKTWDGQMVRRFYGNPLLKGAPERGNRHTVKKHELGRRKSEKNPAGPISWSCPHLAYLDPVTFAALNAHLAGHNAKLGRKPVDGSDPRAGLSRKRTRFPAQWACCGYCGRHDVLGANGIGDSLMCSGSREWRCWNSVGYPRRLAVQRVRSALTAELYALEGIDEQFRELVQAAGRDRSGNAAHRWEQLRKAEAALAVQQQNLADTMVAYGPVPFVKDKLREVEATQLQLARERQAQEALGKRTLKVPESAAELRAEVDAAFASLAEGSWEFGELLRKLVPEFHVYLVRLCDGGHPLPRARVRLALDGLVPDARHVAGLSNVLSRTLTPDLFVPPQRERIRSEAVRLAARGLGPKQIAARITEPDGTHPTATAVQNALKLHAAMAARGLTSPYLVLREPPADYSKLRRHKNPKYRFERRAGYEPPPLEPSE